MPRSTRKRKTRRRSRRRLRRLTPPFPLSIGAIAVLIFGHLLWFIICANLVGIGSGFWPLFGYPDKHLQGLGELTSYLHWIAHSLALLLIVQIYSEWRRPSLERRLRKPRIICDCFALFVAAFIIAIPWQMDHLVDRMHQVQRDTYIDFEYDFRDQKWHWVPPPKSGK